MKNIDKIMGIEEMVNQCNLNLQSSPYRYGVQNNNLILFNSDGEVAAPAALIPYEPIKYVAKDGTESASIYVIGYHNGIYLPPIEVTSHLKNFDFIYSNWGMNHFPLLSKKEEMAVRHCYSAIALTLREKLIYDFEAGWIDNKHLLIKNILVSTSEIKKINNKTITKDLDFAPLARKEGCSFLFNNYLTVCNNATYSMTMLIVVILGVLYPRILEESDMIPSFGLYIYGNTGTRKTSSVMAMANPFCNIGSSFEDTPASVFENFKNTALGCYIIDDLKKVTTDAISILKKIIRLIGDKSTRGSKMIGNKVQEANINSMCIITGEHELHLQESSMARLLVFEYTHDTINTDQLTKLQTSQTQLRSALLGLIQLLIHDIDLIENLSADVCLKRAELSNEFQRHNIHGRYIDMMAWLIQMYEIIAKKFEECGVELNLEYPTAIKELIFNQHLKYRCDVVSTFANCLFELYKCNQLVVRNETDFSSGQVVDVIDYGEEWFIASGRVYDKICEYAEKKQKSITFSEKALRSSLLDAKILKQRNDKNTYELRKSGHRCSGFYIRKNMLKNYLNNN